MIAALERAQADKGDPRRGRHRRRWAFLLGRRHLRHGRERAHGGRERMRLSHQLIRLMVSAACPVVAAVEGFCVGAGLSLACASDTVVAAEDARFGAGFGKIGLMADLGLPHTLPLRVGPGQARQILLYHEQMTAAEAERIGLVDHVVPKGHALQRRWRRRASSPSRRRRRWR
jgi:enoyl-CoA hydratase/carnithine racemase